MSPDALVTVIRTLALPDADFFALDEAATLALQTRIAALAQGPSRPGARAPLPELRAIGAPAQVDWSRRTTFPLLLAEARGNMREWEVHAMQNRALTVSNLDSGAVDVIAPLDKGRRMPILTPSRSGPPPDDFNAGLSSIGVRGYDLLHWFPRQFLEGRLAITFLDYDLVSNTVLVNASMVRRGTDATQNAGASLRAPGRIAVLPVPPSAAPGGVTLSVPPRIVAEPARLRADVHLPRSRVTAIDRSPGANHPMLLAASLLLVQIDRLQPVVLHLAVPAAPGGGGNVDAAFTLDLRGALAGRAGSGAWLVYLVLGDTVTGPQPLNIELP
jgi:hypothetical protein